VTYGFYESFASRFENEKAQYHYDPGLFCGEEGMN
jgi:hypothetical protein